MTTSREMYDVLVEVPAYGICSPYNSHSYRGHLLLFPSACSCCKQVMYPLITAAVSCIRCRSVCHRGLCMRSTKSSCPRIDRTDIVKSHHKLPPVTIGNSDELAKLFGGMITSSISCRITKHSDKMLVTTPERLTSPTVPSPGSANCIWKKELQLIASRQVDKNMRKGVQFQLAESPDNELIRAFDSLIETVLEDTSRFPGQVCATLHALYLDKQFSSDVDTLLHARECLDAISCAVLSFLPVGFTACDHSTAEQVSTVVDRYVLGMSHRAMYCKAFLAAHLVSASDDHKFSSLNSQYNHHNMNKQDLSCSTTTKMCEYCADARHVLAQTSTLLAPRDKLSHLKKALQEISKSVLQHTCRCSRDPCPPDITETYDDVETKIDPECQHNSTGQIDPDCLIEVISNILLADNSSTGVGTGRHTIHWFAECTYMEYMMREGEWALGIESYALTTLMQSLRSIIQDH